MADLTPKPPLRNDLDAIYSEFLIVCGSCDYGVPGPCECTQRDWRPTMLALTEEITQLRTAVTRLAQSVLAMAALGGMPDTYWYTDSRIAFALRHLGLTHDEGQAVAGDLAQQPDPDDY